jgi:hypothetical protein
MKRKTILFSLLALFVAASVSFAADSPFMGTWKLNEAKSKFGAGATKNQTVVYAAAGDSIKVTGDGVDGDGKPAHSEWTGKFDGKDYALTGDATGDMRSYKAVNANTLSMTNSKAGKESLTGTIVVSADGKTRTVTTHWTDAKGAKLTSTAVYDKQ